MFPISSEFELRLLDLFPAQAVIIDESGTIIYANRSWKSFGAANGLNDPNSRVGESYLEDCTRAARRGLRGAVSIGRGLRRVLNGERDSFKFTYKALKPDHQVVWFQIIAAPIGSSGNGALILHLDVTHQRLLAQRFLRRTEYRNNRVVVCAWCRRIRNDEKWMTIEEYFNARYRHAFSHGICPECQSAFRV